MAPKKKQVVNNKNNKNKEENQPAKNNKNNEEKNNKKEKELETFTDAQQEKLFADEKQHFESNNHSTEYKYQSEGREYTFSFRREQQQQQQLYKYVVTQHYVKDKNSDPSGDLYKRQVRTFFFDVAKSGLTKFREVTGMGGAYACSAACEIRIVAATAEVTNEQRSSPVSFLTEDQHNLFLSGVFRFIGAMKSGVKKPVAALGMAYTDYKPAATAARVASTTTEASSNDDNNNNNSNNNPAPPSADDLQRLSSLDSVNFGDDTQLRSAWKLIGENVPWLLRVSALQRRHETVFDTSASEIMHSNFRVHRKSIAQKVKEWLRQNNPGHNNAKINNDNNNPPPASGVNNEDAASVSIDNIPVPSFGSHNSEDAANSSNNNNNNNVDVQTKNTHTQDIDDTNNDNNQDSAMKKETLEERGDEDVLIEFSFDNIDALAKNLQEDDDREEEYGGSLFKEYQQQLRLPEQQREHQQQQTLQRQNNNNTTNDGNNSNNTVRVGEDDDGSKKSSGDGGVEQQQQQPEPQQQENVPPVASPAVADADPLLECINGLLRKRQLAGFWVNMTIGNWNEIASVFVECWDYVQKCREFDGIRELFVEEGLMKAMPIRVPDAIAQAKRARQALFKRYPCRRDEYVDSREVTLLAVDMKKNNNNNITTAASISRINNNNTNNKDNNKNDTAICSEAGHQISSNLPLGAAVASNNNSNNNNNTSSYSSNNSNNSCLVVNSGGVINSGAVASHNNNNNRNNNNSSSVNNYNGNISNNSCLVVNNSGGAVASNNNNNNSNSGGAVASCDNNNNVKQMKEFIRQADFSYADYLLRYLQPDIFDWIYRVVFPIVLHDHEGNSFVDYLQGLFWEVFFSETEANKKRQLRDKWGAAVKTIFLKTHKEYLGIFKGIATGALFSFLQPSRPHETWTEIFQRCVQTTRKEIDSDFRKELEGESQRSIQTFFYWCYGNRPDARAAAEARLRFVTDGNSVCWLDQFCTRGMLTVCIYLHLGDGANCVHPIFMARRHVNISGVTSLINQLGETIPPYFLLEEGNDQHGEYLPQRRDRGEEDEKKTSQ